MKKLFTTAILISALATPAAAQMVNFKDIERGLSPRNTEAKREVFWDTVDGKMTKFTGRVTDVEASGWILNTAVHVDIDGSKINAVCYVREEANESTVLSLNKGNHVTCYGRLLTYSLLFGTTIQVTDSTVTK